MVKNWQRSMTDTLKNQLIRVGFLTIQKSLGKWACSQALTQPVGVPLVNIGEKMHLAN